MLGEGELPTAEVDGRRVAVLAQAGVWYAVVGIPLDTRAPSLTLSVRWPSAVDAADARPANVPSPPHSDPNEDATAKRAQIRSIEIRPKSYREQHIAIDNPDYVTPSSEQIQRFQRERALMDAARATFSTDGTPDLRLRAPITGRRSDSFGFRRYYNGEPRSPHSGMDIAGDAGEPVQAPTAGRVARTGDYFFNGKTVMLDHGHGFVTLYCHLSRIDVAEGDAIESGDQLGTVGATGRATGPHLHFSAYLSGIAVDPALLLEPAN